MEHNKLEKYKDFNQTKYPVVKATVACILFKNKKVLLTQRNIEPERGKWCIPGGHIDIGETAIQCVQREVEEETGLKIKNPRFFDYYDEYIPDLKLHSLVLVFYGDPEGKEKPNEEVTEQRWFSYYEIKNLEMAFQHKSIILNFLEKRI